MTFPDPGHVNGFYLRQFFGMTEWAAGGHDHPLEYVDPRTPEGLDTIAALLTPTSTPSARRRRPPWLAPGPTP